MVLALPVSQVLFVHIKEALIHVYGRRVIMTRGAHQYLAYYRWLNKNLGQCLTQLYKPVNLHTAPVGYHNSSRYMCKG